MIPDGQQCLVQFLHARTMEASRDWAERYRTWLRSGGVRATHLVVDATGWPRTVAVTRLLPKEAAVQILEGLQIPIDNILNNIPNEDLK